MVDVSDGVGRFAFPGVERAESEHGVIAYAFGVLVRIVTLLVNNYIPPRTIIEWNFYLVLPSLTSNIRTC